MGLLILASSLLLATAQGDGQGQSAAPDQPPAASTPAAPRDRTTSPPGGKPPVDPRPNVDPGIQLPPDQLPTGPQTPGQTHRPKDDSAKPTDDSVKSVLRAPSEPGKPGVRPL